MNREQELLKLMQQMTNIKTIFGGTVPLNSIEYYLQACHRGKLWGTSGTINYILDNTKGTGERKRD
jgi:hypothetical protein